MNKTRMRTKLVVIMGLLVAMEIVLNRFLSINAWNIKIGFSFIPVVVAAMVYGPLYGAIVGGLGDFLGAIMFPIGQYFPGFTFTAVLMGLVWGFFLHKEQTLPRIIAATAINQFILGLFLNTYWISFLYGSQYWPLFTTRILQAAVLFVAQVIIIYAMKKFIPRFKELMR